MVACEKARRWTGRGSCGHLLLLEVVKLSPTQEKAENRPTGPTGRNIAAHTNPDTRRKIPRAVWFGCDSVGVSSTNHGRVELTSKPGLIKTTWPKVSSGLHHRPDKAPPNRRDAIHDVSARSDRSIFAAGEGVSWSTTGFLKLTGLTRAPDRPHRSHRTVVAASQFREQPQEIVSIVLGWTRRWSSGRLGKIWGCTSGYVTWVPIDLQRYPFRGVADNVDIFPLLSSPRSRG